jgi:hypothetical protein
LITDLRTPTPFTLTNAIYGLSNCEGSETNIVLATALIDSTPYLASCAATFSDTPIFYETIVFTDLTVTSLTRGEVITIVYRLMLSLKTDDRLTPEK